ncbi:MAG: tetratricopeptide (TPR) repeat protein [Bacteroidia bacterium]|jgi:tetratricopeptide (TPR) repeat protein
MLKIMLRMGKTYGLLILLMFAFNAVFGQVEITKSEADQAFIEQRYADAIGLYEEILGQQYVSTEVHFNLGNAYFKAGKIAPSILNYERAAKLSPNDEDIVFNLKLANLSVKDRVEEIPQLFFVDWWEAALITFPVDGWAWSIIISMLMALTGFSLFKFSSEEGMRRLTFYSALLATLWFGFSVYAAQKSFNHAANDNRAVVYAYTINAKSAPDKKGKDLFVMHEGLVVTVSDELNGWVRIKLSNGSVGWVPADVLVMI